MTVATSNGWASVPLGEVLTRRKDAVIVQETDLYKRITIRLNGRGVVLRDETIGARIGTKRQFCVKANQFILSKIDARNGAFGVVPPDCDNAIITGNFWAFDAKIGKLDPKYFSYLTRTLLFRDFSIRASEGSTNRRYLQEDRFLAERIPLPPLAEQRRIVAKIDHLAAKIEEAHGLKQHITRDALAMLRGAFASISEGVPKVTMATAAPLVRRKVEVKMGEEYPELGVRCFGKGTFPKPSLNFLSVGNKKLYYIKPGDLLFSNVFAWEGAIAVAGTDAKGRVGSHRFITCLPNPEIATAEYLRFYFLTHKGLSKIGDASPGGAGRNRTLGLKKLEKISVPIASLEKQEWFNGLQAKVDNLKRLQEKTATELDALLPSILDRAFKGEL